MTLIELLQEAWHALPYFSAGLGVGLYVEARLSHRELRRVIQKSHAVTSAEEKE